MLLKWIICDTDVDKKTSFSLAQEEWKTLKRVKGFIAQAGGWCANEEPKAGILAFWKLIISHEEIDNQNDSILMQLEPKWMVL